MIKRVILVSCLVFMAAFGVGAQTVRVGVLPGAVNAAEDLGYLKGGLQEMLSAQLGAIGLKAASPAELNTLLRREGLGAALTDDEKARELGRALGLSYVLRPTLTKLGSRVVLGVGIVDVLGLAGQARVESQDEGLENLSRLVRSVSRALAVKLSQRDIITRISIQGNERIEAEAIAAAIASREGDIYSEERLSQDLKSVYAMNFFSDVRVEAIDEAGGKAVIFTVEERPSIQDIVISGLSRMKEEEVLEVLGYEPYSIVDNGKLARSVENIKELYRQDGYYNADITYEVKDLGDKRVEISYRIKENRRVYLREIKFVGNDSFSPRKLKKLMETTEKGLLNWIWDKGVLSRDELDKDIAKILDHYYNSGFMLAQISSPEVELKEDGLHVTITISEGPRFKMGALTFDGDLIFDKKELLETTKIDDLEYFSREALQADIMAVTEKYSSLGYAYANVQPLVNRHDDIDNVDIQLKIEKGNLVYFERIEIVGNTKTRDYVIRREFRVAEGELFNADALRKSAMALYRLSFFEDIKFNQSKGSAEDKINIRLSVKEKPTGAFSVGAGYSSYNKLFGLVRVSQANLFGRGQSIQLQGSFGSKITEYALSFSEPYLLGTRVTFGASVFHRTVSYDEYDKFSKGFSFNLGYPIFEYVHLSGGYSFEDAEILDVADDASDTIKLMRGKHQNSMLTFVLSRDTRDQAFNPSRGTLNSLTLEYAGGMLGGTNYYTRYIAHSGFIIPLGGSHRISVQGKAGYVARRPGGRLPVYEKFVLGGINSLRGFEWGSVGPKDPITGDTIGGDKMLVFNVEYVFPILKDAGFMGVIFFDMGNAYAEEENIDFGRMRKSAGIGFRFYSPMGPIRLEWGWILDRKPGEKKGDWEFTIGSFF